MKRRAVVFVEPARVEIQEEALSPPGPGQALARTIVSAISPGTELLVYRGQLPAGLPLDAAIPALGGAPSYPLRYGYAAVGRVVEAGPGVEPSWLGRLVFSFQPHVSHFAARVDELIPLPEAIDAELGAFTPNLETAVNLVMDGRPLIGERVVVLGQGVVGLLTAALLARFPLARLITLDRIAARRRASLDFGVTLSLDPAALEQAAGRRELRDALRLDGERGGADLVYELTGDPRALDLALDLTGFGSRIVVGSWYGAKRASLDLGGRFHRDRISLVSSQVSTIAPEWTGRWDTARRLETVLSLLPSLDLARLITHRLPVERAPEAYALLDRRPHEALQILLTYD